MQDPVVVEMGDAPQQLQHEALDLTVQHGLRDALQQLFEIVLHKLHDNKNIVDRSANHNLVHADDVFVLGLEGESTGRRNSKPLYTRIRLHPRQP